MLQVCATPEGLDVVKNLSRTFTFMVKKKKHPAAFQHTMIFSLLFGSLSYQHVLHTLFSIIPRQSSPKLAVPKTLNLKSTSAGSAHICTETCSSLSTLRSQACLREVSADAMVLSGPRVRSMVRWKNNYVIQSCLCIISLFFWQPYPHLLPSTHSTPSFWSPCLQSLHPVFPHIQLGEQEAGGAGLSLKHPYSEDLDSQSHLTCSEIIDISHSPFIGQVYHI